MKIEKFEDIIIWQKAYQLSISLYQALQLCRDYSYKDQIQRASVSIMNNVAEGFERKGNKEFKKYLYISKGSCAEVRSLLYLGKSLKYIHDSMYSHLHTSTIEISKMLSGLIKSLK